MRAIERFHVPTVEALLRVDGVDKEAAGRLVAVFQRYQNDRHFSVEAALRACDELLGTYGVESLAIEGAHDHSDGGIRMCPQFSYCNTGDAYALTVARDHKRSAWVIAGWGDLAEEYEKENKLGDHEEFEERPEQCPSCHGARFALESFERGYSFVCADCNHHCLTPDGWTPAESGGSP